MDKVVISDANPNLVHDFKEEGRPFDHLIKIQVILDDQKILYLTVNYDGKINCNDYALWRACAKIAKDSKGNSKIPHGISIAASYWLIMNQGIDP